MTTPGTLAHGGIHVADYIVNGLRHALIVCPKDNELASMWGPPVKIGGALSYADGLANTTAMAEAGCGLAQALRERDLNGFSDWYLPSRLESLILFGELPGEFEREWYWTSTQCASNPDYAWCQYFVGGVQDGYRKGHRMRARAVRRVAL